MPAIRHPLSLGRLLAETFDIYRHNFLLFLGISAIPNGVLLVILILFDKTLGTIRNGVGILGALEVLFTIVAIVVVPSILIAATTFAVSDICLERTTSIKSCFFRVSGKVFKILAVSLTVGIIVGFGLLVFLAPGVYWAGVFGVAIPAVVLENIPVGQALPRSSDLTQDFRSRVIIVFFLTMIFSGIMKYALNAGLLWLWPIIHSHLVHLTKLNLRDISSVLAMTLFGSVSAIGLTLVYYDLRVRKEPFDLMMDRMGDAETVAAESDQQSAVGSQ
ncbi:MAG TPA: hypothetical protein VE054_06995 [Blattabacteriaceae bacterium]|nr:hypothetical protein [Blattabacteriaceae bacterium]